MRSELPQEYDPYAGRTPFDVLGVSGEADARQLRRAREQMLKEALNDRQLSTEQRTARMKAIDAAYEAVKDPRSRVAVEMFQFDEGLGRRQCMRLAEKSKTVSFDYKRVLGAEEDVLPSRPALEGPLAEPRPVELAQFERLPTRPQMAAADLRREVLESIRFEA